MVTPMAAPTSTSLGVSTPRYMRSRASRVTSPVATHLPACRQRPLGTRLYSIVTRMAENQATGRDGIAQLPQVPRISTPNGRGRRAAADRATTARLTTWKEISPTIMCRKRL